MRSGQGHRKKDAFTLSATLATNLDRMILGSTLTLVTLLRSWIRRSTMINSA